MSSVDVGLHTFRSPKFSSVVREAIQFLEGTPVHVMPPAEGFVGVGVYALYYKGNFQPYKHIRSANLESCTMPIYVGKAVPPGWRASRQSRNVSSQALYARLGEHARSVSQGKHLVLADFTCRFMILDGIETDLVTAVEAELIRRYRPLWNCCVEGFGNHDPGSGRYDQARSEWDVLHPGRPWAERLTTGTPPERRTILSKIKRQRELALP